MKAVWFALVSVFLWSTVASAFKISLHYFSPLQLLCFADCTSIIVLSVLLLYQKRLHELCKASRTNWINSVKYGFLNPFLYYLVLLYAYDILPAQQAQAINYTWAIALTILSIPFLQQRVSLLHFIAIGVSYSGVLVICTSGSFDILGLDNPAGVLLALLSTLIWAFYWIMNTKDQRDPVLGLLMNFICALPMIGAALIVEYYAVGLKEIGWKGMAGAVYVGLFEMGLAFVCWLYAMKTTRNTASIANLIFLAPVISLFLIYFLVGEVILPSTIIGLGVILLGLFIQGVAEKNNKFDQSTEG